MATSPHSVIPGTSNTATYIVDYFGWGWVGGNPAQDLGTELPVTVDSVVIVSHYHDNSGNRSFILEGDHTGLPNFFPLNVKWQDSNLVHPIIDSTTVTVANGWTQVPYNGTFDCTKWTHFLGSGYANPVTDFNPVITITVIEAIIGGPTELLGEKIIANVLDEAILN